MRRGVNVLLVVAMCAAGSSGCSDSGDSEGDCHIPQPMVGDFGLAQLQAHPSRHRLVASFGGREWTARVSGDRRIPATSDAAVIAARQTGWKPGDQRPSPYPRLQIGTDDPIILHLNVIGCG